jgi:N-acetylglutamate synthase-like GNAT family acetyltransferase
LPDPTAVTPKDRLSLPADDEPINLARGGSVPAKAPLARTGRGAKESMADKDRPYPAPLAAFPPRPDDVQVRRARPSDVPSVLLLIQKATAGRKKMKRAELLMALSERGYFIGQTGAEISTVFGYHLDSQVGRIDEMYIHPLTETLVTGAAVLEDITRSAQMHMGQIIVAFLPKDAPENLFQLFRTAGYDYFEKDQLPANWQLAIDESQPEKSYFMIKILRDVRRG